MGWRYPPLSTFWNHPCFALLVCMHLRIIKELTKSHFFGTLACNAKPDEFPSITLLANIVSKTLWYHWPPSTVSAALETTVFPEWSRRAENGSSSIRCGLLAFLGSCTFPSFSTAGIHAVLARGSKNSTADSRPCYWPPRRNFNLWTGFDLPEIHMSLRKKKKGRNFLFWTSIAILARRKLQLG